jgi:hypothetical protein
MSDIGIGFVANVKEIVVYNYVMVGFKFITSLTYLVRLSWFASVKVKLFPLYDSLIRQGLNLKTERQTRRTQITINHLAIYHLESFRDKIRKVF